MGLGRFELPTSRLSGVRSNQLSYRPMNFAAKKSHTSLGVRSVLTVDAPEGRVASVAITACDLLRLNYERTDSFIEISNFKFFY